MPAILVGLLAMHALTGSDAAHGTKATTTAIAHVEASGPAAIHAHEGAQCDGLCEHDTLGIACILALLISALILVVHLTLLRWGSLRAAASALLARVSALAPPHPPSLLALSISRT